MSIKFFNTLSKKKEIFTPINKDSVRLYTCGPTVYDAAHVGNFRTFIFEDLLKRFLLHKNYTVNHIMNITDVDDKTIRKSINENKSLADLTKKYTDLFFNDLNWLKIVPADVFPKATEHIPEMIEMISKLMDKKIAYKSGDNSVFFNIEKYPEYGKLININKNFLRSSVRISDDEYDKDNPQDFALWKSYKPEDGDVWWDSPFGKGRPGWHIECSAMSIKYLGEYFDIHCGGIDNIFPHHENEIAQSCAATGLKFVNFWLHSEHLQIQGDKMSKSSKNFYRIDDLKKQGFTPEVVRYLLLNGHYRKKINFSIDKRLEGEQALQRIADVYNKLSNFIDDDINSNDSLPPAYDEFIAYLEDDLNTPKALAVVYSWIKIINKSFGSNRIDKKTAMSGLNFLKIVDNIFDFITPKKNIPFQIQSLIDKRNIARESNEWTEADKIRDKILSLGWKIEDTKDGVTCKPT